MTKRENDLPRLAAELARWRNEAGMTQQELAVAVGATLNYIQKVEGKGGKTKVRPSMDRLVLIVSALDRARYDKGLTDQAQRIDMNYVLRLAGYPEIAVPMEWEFVLQEISKIPTELLHTQEGVTRAAQEIVRKLEKGGRDDETVQRSRSDQGDEGDSQDSKGETPKSKEDQHHPKPIHKGR